jgi:3alpha(or 20beta)-hydroxysteroid dehydrogenase
MGSLDGKIAIVTGAARGTGAVTARRMLEEGARVVLGDVRHEQGEKVAAALGEAASYVPHDVTDEAQWSGIVQHTLQRHGRVDVLVNNAAILHIGTVERTGPDKLREILEVNTVGPYLGIRAVLAPMRQQGGGSIVMVNSIDGILGMNGVASYAASKWGLRGLAKSVGIELGRDGIRVNSVCPAGGNPEMFAPWFEQMVPFLDETRAYSANRGIPGEAPLECIADAVIFLASDASRHCTGVDLPVDGGAHAGRFIPGFNTL